MNAPIYLGRPAFDPRPFTRINPIALAEEGMWRVYQDFTAALPSEGRVFAPRLVGFNSSSILAFGVEPNTKNEQERDRFVVARTWGVYEVLDYRHVEIEICRRRLVELGLDRLLPGSEFVVAVLKDGTCVVVKMARHPTADRWIADYNGLDHQEVRTFDLRLFDGDQVENRWISVPGVSVGQPIGAINWCRDGDFLDYVLKRLRKMSLQSGAGIPRAQIAPLVAQLERAELFPSSGVELEPTLARLKSFAPRLIRNVRAVDEIFEFLENLSPVRDRVEAAFFQRRSELEAEVRRVVEEQTRQAVEASLESKVQERDRLVEEIQLRKESVAAEKVDLDAARDELVKLRSDLKDDLTRTLDGLGQTLSASDQNIEQLTSRFASRLGESGGNFSIAATRGPPWTIPRFLGGHFKAWSELSSTMQAMAGRWGINTEDLQFADAGVRAGRLIVMPSNAASNLVGCYADVMSGGAFIRHVLDPSVICVDDLWRQPASGRTTAFARAWAAALVDDRRFQIVLLDGLHLTPMSLWTQTLIDLMDEPRRPTNLLIFAALGEEFIDPERKWSGLAEVVIPLSPLPTQVAQTPRLLARATGRTQAANVFDATAAPQPATEDIFQLLTEMESSVSAPKLELAVGMYRAAWGINADRAMDFARVIAGRQNGLSEAFVNGTAWLKERLEIKS